MKMHKKIVAVISIMSLVLLTACAQTAQLQVDQAQTNEGRMTVYADTYPTYDFTKKIGGDRISLEIITPPAADPHSYEPTAQQLAGLEKADLFLYVGLEVQPWAEKYAQNAKTSGRDNVFLVTQNISLLKFDEDHDHEGEHHEDEDHDHEEEHHEDEHHEHEHGEYDPHVWMDPMRAKQMADNIRKYLSQKDAANEQYYRENYEALAAQLDALDQEYLTGLANTSKKEIIVSHAAFGYLTNRYGLRQISISGISPEAEPQPARLVELIKYVREHNIRHIFFEVIATPKTAEILAKEAGVETLVLDPIEGAEEGQDYFSIMRGNLKNLLIALSE